MLIKEILTLKPSKLSKPIKDAEGKWGLKISDYTVASIVGDVRIVCAEAVISMEW
jgi:hypothetical protein